MTMPTPLPLALSVADLWATDAATGATLHNVCLDIPAGDVVAVEDSRPENIHLFVECLTGDHLPLHGQISVAGTPLTRPDRGALWHWQRSMIYPLHPPTPRGQESIEQYVAADEHRHTGTGATPRTRAVLERVGLLEISERAAADVGPAKALALELARALIWNPAVLMLPEADRWLGEPGLTAMATLLQDLSLLEGRTVLIATSTPAAIPAKVARTSL